MAESELYDVLIVGAGPCGLAVAARLRESHPSALFTDEEQARYNWIAQHASKASIKNKRNGSVRPPSDTQHRHNHHDAPSMLTLDASGAAWMSSWNRLFSNFGISHLRSPMFFHPDPQSRDALLAYTYSNERDGELQEITGCVGKEISKHRKKKERARHTHAKPVVTIDERDRKDYFTPSTAVFNDFCESCIRRYGLSGHIKQERVQDIDYGSTDDDAFPGQGIFTVRTNLGVYHARVVVLAVGAGKPTIPKPFPRDIQEGACHAMAIQKYKGLLLDRSVKAKMDQGKKTNVLVIGGGLTSAQVADAVVKTGVTQVHLLMRSAWKTKPFDVDLSWIAKFRNHQQASFWSADTDEERLEYVKEARNGGSITPRFSKKLKQHVDNGRLQVHCHTTVQTQSFDKISRTWRLTTEPPIPDLPDFDYIYFATGASLDFETVEYLQTLQRKYPIETCSGFPVLNDDLMWPGVPLFMTGKLATLRIGPGAGNLEGARVAAERCSWAIENLLGKKDVTEDESAHERYVAGVGSRFESLMDSEEAESE